MPVRLPDSGLESLDGRYQSMTRLLPYIMLLVPLIPYIVTQQPSGGSVLITLGVAAGAAVWIYVLTMLNPAWMERPWLVRLYMAGLITFTFVLTVRSPWFAFFTWIGFLHAFRYESGRIRWVVAMPIAVAFGMAQTGGFHRPDVSWIFVWLVLAAVDLGLVGGFGLLGARSEEQNMARKAMIADLAEANQRLEEMMAENTGLQAQLLLQAREAGVGDERQRMAREIHDTLAQGLTGIITQLVVAQQADNEAEQERRIGNAMQLARDSLAEARRSVRALRPKALEHSRLPEALADETARWSATNGVAAEVGTNGEVRALHPEIEVTLLRVAQEALANVAKHAKATRVGVTLSYMEDVVTLDVRDDGVGFHPAGQDTVIERPAGGCSRASSQPGTDQVSGGFGLIAMRQRVQRLAGQLEIESEAGAGTAVSASIPAIPLSADGDPAPRVDGKVRATVIP